MKPFTSGGFNRYVIMHTVLFAFHFPERARTSNWKTQVATGKHDNKAQQISSHVNSRTDGSPKIFQKCPHIQTCLCNYTCISVRKWPFPFYFNPSIAAEVRPAWELVRACGRRRGSACVAPWSQGPGTHHPSPLTAFTSTHSSLCLDNVRV